jgi:hypothetical protein
MGGIRLQNSHSIIFTSRISRINQLQWLHYWLRLGAPGLQLRITPHVIHEPFPPYFNDTGWSITTMPTIFVAEVIGAVWVMGFFGCAGT